MAEIRSPAAGHAARAGIETAGHGSNTGIRQNLQGDSRPRLRLISFKPLIKNSLRGFVELELPDGLRLVDCPVLVSNDKAWVSLPSKPMLDREGRQKTGADGKSAYVPVLRWRDRDLQNRFSDAVIDLVRAQYPDALGGAP